uniref:Uncharacterized protein n=1 Tax=viral metagenome TaxID=1070528 RepID=A0A6M3K2H9_9ZZZZ
MEKITTCWICGKESDQGACCKACEDSKQYENLLSLGLVDKLEPEELDGSWDNGIKFLEG